MNRRERAQVERIREVALQLRCQVRRLQAERDELAARVEDPGAELRGTP